MRIGVVSDTHNNRQNVQRIIDIFNEQQLDCVVHTGDITRASTLSMFADLNCPLHGVYGNNDMGEKESLEQIVKQFNFNFTDPPMTVCWHDRQIAVVHDPLEFAEVTTPHSLALHGHTHLQRIENEGDKLIFNPGECAGHMKGLNAIGIVDLETMTPEILNF